MDQIMDVALARQLAEARAAGVAPPKGSPEGDALRRAAKRVDPRGAIAKAGKADYRARSGYGTTDSDRLTDARLAARSSELSRRLRPRRSKNAPSTTRR